MDENERIIDEVTIKEDSGKIDISDDVIATIAGIATNEIDGVYGMSGGVVGGIAEKLGGKKNLQKGVKVDVKPEGAVIELYIIVNFGVRIPDLAWNIQENVKNSVETMTGIDVKKVNIHIDGVKFREEEPKKAEEKKQKEQPEPTTDKQLDAEPSEVLDETEIPSD